MRREELDAPPASAADLPWLKVYPAGVPAGIEQPRYRLLGEAAPDLSARWGGRSAFTTIMPNGMSGSLSFAEVDRLSGAFAAYLRDCLGLAAGSRVAIQTPNGLAYPIVAFGVFKAGCVLVNINPLYTAAEMIHVFKDAKPSVIVVIDMFAEKLATALEQAPVPHVILSEAASLFPPHARLIIGFVQKHLRREVPEPRFASVPIAKALAMGAHKVASGADLAAYAAGLEPSSPACLQYTGGTTGVSKAAMLTHRNLIVNVAQFLVFVGGAIAESDHVLTALPLYHSFAFTVNMLGFFFRGAHNVLIPNPRPLINMRRAFAKQPISFITGVNTLFNGLLNESWFTDNPPPALKLSAAGGMALHESVARRWEAITKSPLIEGYGLSEASPVLTFNPPYRVKPGSIGVPLPWTEIQCVDDAGREAHPGEHGELIARGPQVMAGYWNQPEETKIALRDGWLYTGDIATMDSEGYFTIVDRRKDMILVSGFNVYPNEVEAVLSQLPGVRECAVIGVADECSGEAVKAFIVRSDESLDAETVRAFCKTQLAAYKTPKIVAFRDDLPKSNVGKILRRNLRMEALLEADPPKA
ncbi:AMP-binding protein [Methylocella tundrae]|uniref:Long-chain-fatty-acid--CoA ligase n=1 Tax=Methylocella tundrae TaxID=227605 RepID=A0A4U8YVQ4_METTU|nr:AMP-binding protein [Methylocella tundrae]WPP05040.1 AMP-binding protein [Methylocella tundrae]VFU07337.1 Long-chain-fatty-acid--CoA ligase [Methylocella tundrae]